jgi:hypothetical protein
VATYCFARTPALYLNLAFSATSNEGNRDVTPAMALFGVGTTACPLLFMSFFNCWRLHPLLDPGHVTYPVRYDLVPKAVPVAKIATTEENTLHREVDNSCAFGKFSERPLGGVV